MSKQDWRRSFHAGKCTLSIVDETDSRKNDAAARWMAKNDRAPLSKEEQRHEADRLLAGYRGPVTKVPVGHSGHVSSQERLARPSSGARRSKAERRPTSGDRPQIDRAVPPGLVVYCDGACEPNPGAGGWAFVAYLDGVEIHSDCGGDPVATNNTMEITGALMALRWLHTRDRSQVSARLFCDSRYVVDGCNDWRLAWKARGWKRKGKNPHIANLDLWQALDEALTAVPIRLEWCRGHAGIVGNERADELSLIGREAALAAEEPDTDDLISQQLRYTV